MQRQTKSRLGYLYVYTLSPLQPSSHCCVGQDRHLCQPVFQFRSLRPSAYAFPLVLTLLRRSLYCAVYAAITSGSLSLLATAIDSVFDIGSNILLWWLHRKAVSLDTSKWPVGGARLETIGNCIYGSFIVFCPCLII